MIRKNNYIFHLYLLEKLSKYFLLIFLFYTHAIDERKNIQLSLWIILKMLMKT